MDRPTSFGEDSDWTRWVLDHDMPALPSALGIGDVVPVARWVEADFAAVLSVNWFEDEEDGSRIEYEIEFADRRAGEWKLCDGSGGSSWFDPPFAAPVMPNFDVQLPGGRTEWHDQAAGEHYRATDGFVGPGITHVEVTHASGVRTRHPIESPIGAVVVCTSGPDPALVRALDQRGAVRGSTEF